jgi:hypothetical protein
VTAAAPIAQPSVTIDASVDAGLFDSRRSASRSSFIRHLDTIVVL